MATSEGYGQRLAERLRAEHAPAVVTRVLRAADMAVTETRWDDPVPGLSGSLQREDAFFVTLALRDYPNRVYWEDGRLVSVCDVRAGQTCIHDLKRDPVALLDKPHHVLFFYLPRRSSEPVVHRPRPLGARGPCCSDLWRDATSVTAGAGWARAVASETRQGNSQRSPRW